MVATSLILSDKVVERGPAQYKRNKYRALVYMKLFTGVRGRGGITVGKEVIHTKKKTRKVNGAAINNVTVQREQIHGMNWYMGQLE